MASTVTVRATAVASAGTPQCPVIGTRTIMGSRRSKPMPVRTSASRQGCGAGRNDDVVTAADTGWATAPAEVTPISAASASGACEPRGRRRSAGVWGTVRWGRTVPPVDHPDGVARTGRIRRTSRPAARPRTTEQTVRIDGPEPGGREEPDHRTRQTEPDEHGRQEEPGELQLAASDLAAGEQREERQHGTDREVAAEGRAQRGRVGVLVRQRHRRSADPRGGARHPRGQARHDEVARRRPESMAS